jgi:signal transduction histidine kinase
MEDNFVQKKSLKIKLFLSFIPILIFLVLFIYNLLSLNNSISASFSKINNNITNLSNISDISTVVKSQSNTVKNYVNTTSPVWISKYNELLATYDELIGYISDSSSSSTEKSSYITNFKKITTETQKIEFTAMTRAKSGDQSGALAILNNSYDEKVIIASNLLYSIINTERNDISSLITDNKNYLINDLLLGTAVIVFLMLALLIIVHIFTSSVLKPIEQLADTAKEIADGSNTSRAIIKNPDEIGALAYNFNIMLARLQTSHMALSKKVDELKEVNDKLKKIDQMKSDFITIAAHQLRTPLTGIKWSLTAIVNGDMGPVQKNQKEYLNGAISSNQRMIDTVNDILKMEDIQTGQSYIKTTEVNLADLLNSVLFDIYPQAANKKININLDIDKDTPPSVNIDKESIRTVLQNLLENSILYTNEKGKIEVKISQNEDKVLISIHDNGIGIPENEKKNIFTKFFRATNAIKQYANGNGLGLAIIKNIIQQHGGKIDFESEEGKGTTFNILLPINYI